MHYDIHLCADGSPQAGYNFLCTREEKFAMTHRQYEFGSLYNNFVLASRRLPPAHTSLGNASVIDIAMEIIHIMLLISGSLIDFYRRCVRSFLADQHKESKVTPSTPAALILKACPHKMLTDVPEDSTELLSQCGVHL